MTVKTTRAAAVIAMCALLLAGGCAGPSASRRGGEAGVTLEYGVPDGAPLRYRLSNTIVQSMEIPGQPVEMQTVQRTLVSATPEAGEGDDLRVVVSLDSMSLVVTAGGQVVEADVSGAVGRSFTMLLSPLGEEKNFPPADEIQYDIGQAGKRSAITALQMMFPDLPGKPVEIGDTWVTKDGFVESAEGGSVEIAITSLNTIEGFETVAGLKCARIAGTYTGTTKGSGTQGPAEWTSEGVIEGTSTSYFAYEEGVFVSEATSGSGASTISAVGPDGETVLIPVTQTSSFETILIR